MPSHARRNTCY